MPTRCLRVRSERATYPVFIGPGAVDRLSEFAPRAGHQTVVVSTAPIWRAQGTRVARLMTAADPVLIPDGERAKTVATVAQLCETFLRRGLDRTGTVVAFGGGVVGDVAGFAAAVYLRGIRLVEVPTSLLAQIDSAIGGKVGVNLAAGKNLVGAFHPPAAVLCDPTMLSTLPHREFRAGLYEMVKYGVIASESLFKRLESGVEAMSERPATALTRSIEDCCRIKARIVGRDERESGIRRTLNFGHTVGHALEAITQYRRFRHGEAVAYGMLAAARVSVARDAMPGEDASRLTALIRRLGPLPPVGDLRVSDAIAAMTRDKKVINGRLHFVLCAGIGQTAMATDVTRAELRAALKALGLRG